jgi:hypothetical protein
MTGLTTRSIRIRPQQAFASTPVAPVASGCKAWVFNGGSSTGILGVETIGSSGGTQDFPITPVPDESYGLYPAAGVLPAGMWAISGMLVCTFTGNPSAGDVTVSWPNTEVEAGQFVDNGGIIDGRSAARIATHVFPFEGVVMLDDDWTPEITVRNGTNQVMTDVRVYFDAIGTCADDHHTTPDEEEPFRACIGFSTTSTATVTFRQIEVLPAGVNSLGGAAGDTWEWEAEAPSHHTTLTVTEFSGFGTFSLPATLVSNVGGTKKWTGTAIRQSEDADVVTVRFRWTSANPGGSYRVLLCDIPPEEP